MFCNFFVFVLNMYFLMVICFFLFIMEFRWIVLFLIVYLIVSGFFGMSGLLFFLFFLFCIFVMVCNIFFVFFCFCCFINCWNVFFECIIFVISWRFGNLYDVYWLVINWLYFLCKVVFFVLCCVFIINLVLFNFGIWFCKSDCKRGDMFCIFLI